MSPVDEECSRDCEHDSVGLKDEVARYIESTRERLGIERADMKVLDFGCKDGKAATELRRLGYDAYGVDINRVAIEKGREIWRTLGFDANRLVWWEDPSRSSTLPDDFFHFVYSAEVFEHVQDGESVASEIARITRPGGGGLHTFPGPLRLIEAHLSMPLVHWLPKNSARWLAIRLCVALGREPHWGQLVGKSAAAKTDAYFAYSCDETHYRTLRKWRRLLEENGLVVADVSADHPRVASHRLLGPLATNAVCRRLLGRLISDFWMVECLILRPDDS